MVYPLYLSLLNSLASTLLVIKNKKSVVGIVHSFILRIC